MASDLRKLGPGELCRLLNSTPLGAVLGERQLYRHRSRAGFRIGDGKTVDLLKYLGWLVQQRHMPAEEDPEPDGDPYEDLKTRSRARNLALSLAGRDIGELPAVVDPLRKARAASDFRFFCEQYFPESFPLAWSADHLKVIARIETAVLHGGLFAMATPRGFGKSTLCECACVWAVLYGHRSFVCLIGSDEGHAADMLDAIKTELDGNDRLLEDFPEVCVPIARLDGIANRCSGQLYQGKRTHIGWTAKEVVLPSMPGSAASGAIIKVAGLTGRIRGMKAKRADGKTVRPTLVVLDDPQTDESARSLSQCAGRESILAGAVLGLAGPGQKIAGIMPCTVIRPGDMADTILDRDKHPEWNGERTRMVYRFPADETLWKRYAEIRADSLKAGRAGADATEFYRAHRERMDSGAEVAWPERFNPDELSAIQHAMNLRLQDEAAFFAEYQNEPLADRLGYDEELTPDQIAGKLNRRTRGLASLATQHLTMFVDVQGALLYWVVCGWEEGFGGSVLDYGAWPDQRRAYFTLREANPTLASATGAAGLEGAIYQGLARLTEEVIGREWEREGGTALRIERCLIDANWGTSTDVVYQFCRESKFPTVVLPSHGRFVGASSLPMNEYQPRPGEKAGHHWRITSASGKRVIRYALYDTNYWKSFVQARLAVVPGDRGCLTLYGEEPERHRLLAEQLTAEYRVRTEGRGRVVDEWKIRPERRDNHWLDGVVGCAVGASMMGVTLAEHGTTKASVPSQPRMKFSEMQRLKRREQEGW